jgi:arginase
MSLVTLLGVPWDGSSSYQRGAVDGPAKIRAALRAESSNTWNERGDDLSDPDVLVDAGDLTLPGDPEVVRDAIEHGVAELIAKGARLLTIGGDHSITYPILRAFAHRQHGLTVLQLDAHADLYDEFPHRGRKVDGENSDRGDRYSHATVFARVMEESLASRLIQVGVRTLTAHQRSQAGKFGVEILGPDRWREVSPLLGRVRGPVYVSLDLDVVEPMMAPGISHPEPGGLTVRDVIEIIGAIRAPLVGADIVEYNPHNDVRDLTARVAAKFLKELVGVMRR